MCPSQGAYVCTLMADNLLFDKQGYAMILSPELYKNLSATTVGVQTPGETLRPVQPNSKLDL